MQTVKAAVVQAGTPGTLTETLTKIEHFVADASAAGARLVVFPEAFIGGYPKGETFGTAVGSRSDAGREQFRHYFESAISDFSPLSDITVRLRIYMVIGVVERAGATLYCTALFFGPEGYLGKHRKLMPTAMERVLWGQGDGSTMQAVDVPFGRLGAAICWENYMPLFRTAMYLQGVTLWCAPTVDDRETWQATMRHIAMEGRCFVLSACQFVAAAEPAKSINGGSVIISPLGKILVGPLRDTEGLLLAELDTGDIARGKFDLDTVGHYARPDIFELRIHHPSS
jgi:nitrilase